MKFSAQRDFNAFWHKALEKIASDSDHLTFSSKVLLSQILYESDIPKDLSKKLSDLHQDCQQMQFRYEQIDLRENTSHYKTAYSVDIAAEIQNVFKSMQAKE